MSDNNPYHSVFASLFGPPMRVEVESNEVKRRYDQEITVVHAALVELGVSKPGEYDDAKSVVKLNRLCGRSGRAFEGLLRSLSSLCNDAPLLVDRLARKPGTAAAKQIGSHSTLTVIDDIDDSDDDGPGDDGL